MASPETLALSGHPEADRLLAQDPLALLIGMVLDQQIPLERAFRSPYDLTQRLGRDLDAADIASRDPEVLAKVFAEPPALHRFPGSMAKRVQELCRKLVDDYNGEADSVWKTAKNGEELRRRIRDLPGFGEQKAKIFVALLGKQLGVEPRGWRDAAGEYGKAGTYLSVADIVDPNSLLEVRAYKQSMKKKAKEGG